jgi:hypothetical protein
VVGGQRRTRDIGRRDAALICGVLASLLYVLADILGGYVWPAYSYTSHGISDLMATGAPSRPLVLSLMTVRSLLLIAFVVGVWRSARGTTGLRLTAVLLLAEVTIGQVTATFFPVPQRSVAETAAMHIIGTGLESLCIVLAMACAAAALGKQFRLYSIGTILILLIFGGMAGSQISQIEQGLPTPWLGVTQRINIYAYLLWVALLAVTLLHREAISSQRSAALTASRL